MHTQPAPHTDASPHLPILLVGNPTSRSGKAKQRIDAALAILREKRIPVEFRSTLPFRHTIDMVRRAIDEEGFRTIVYMGGDGTFYEVATGICRSGHVAETHLGMLPSGTANDQGKSFGISSDPDALPANIDVILRDHTLAIDVGLITTYDDADNVVGRDYFFDSLGWGLSAAILAFRNQELEIVRKVPLWRDMYRDHAVYVRAAIHQFGLQWLTGDRFSAEITVDGTTHMFHHLSDLIVSNTLIYAGEWIVDPTASAEDGMVEIMPFRGLREWTTKLITCHKKTRITEEWLRKIGLDRAPALRGSHIDVHLLRPSVDKRLPAQRDGEEFAPADHFRIDVLPRHLHVIVPENFHWI